MAKVVAGRTLDAKVATVIFRQNLSYERRPGGEIWVIDSTTGLRERVKDYSTNLQEANSVSEEMEDFVIAREGHNDSPRGEFVTLMSAVDRNGLTDSEEAFLICVAALFVVGELSPKDVLELGGWMTAWLGNPDWSEEANGQRREDASERLMALLYGMVETIEPDDIALLRTHSWQLGRELERLNGKVSELMVSKSRLESELALIQSRWSRTSALDERLKGDPL